MVLHYRQSQCGVVGPIVQGVKDNSGADAPVIVQAVTLVDETGATLNTGGELPVMDSQSARVADAIGAVADEPWDGVTAGATVISILKRIALNTTPTP